MKTKTRCSNGAHGVTRPTGMKFTIGSVPVEAFSTPPALKKIQAAAMGLPDGTLLRTRDLAALAGVSHASMTALAAASPSLAPHRVAGPGGHLTLWGNARTIAAYRREFLKN